MREGLVVIDQHRAHVKILFEEYLARAEKQEVVSQHVMFPEVISLDAGQQAVHIPQETLLLLAQLIERAHEHIARRAHGAFHI